MTECFVPRTLSNRFMTSITEADVFVFRKKANMSHSFARNGYVRKFRHKKTIDSHIENQSMYVII
mgnify:FL=1